MKAPPRLLQDPSLAPELRAELERALAAPEPYDPLKGELKLNAALGLAAAPLVEQSSSAAAPPPLAAAEPALSTAATGLLASTGAKLGLAALTAAAIVTGSVVMRERPAQRAVPDAGAPARSQAPQPAATPGPITPVPVPQASTPEPEPAPQAPAPARAATDIDAASRREIAQVGRIKQSLERDPAKAYALAQAGHREFPAGMLREEREALAVLALWNMGRAAEAERRARAFLARYPNSAVRGPLERRLQLEAQRRDPAP